MWEEIKLEWTGFNGAGDPFKENVAQDAIIVRTCKVRSKSSEKRLM